MHPKHVALFVVASFLFTRSSFSQEAGEDFVIFEQGEASIENFAHSFFHARQTQLLADSSCQISMIEPAAVFHFDTTYNWACGGSWNGAPVDSTNGPSDAQKQLSLDLSFYESSDSSIVFMEVSNLITGNGIWVTGSCYIGFTLTSLLIEAPGVLGVNLDYARVGQEVCFGDCSIPEALCSLQGWAASLTESGFDLSTTACPDFGLVNFGNITGSTRIRNGLLVAINIDESFSLDALNPSITFGCGQQTIYPISFIAYGCTDDSACNYNPIATQDDGSCDMPSCTDEEACNFDPNAICEGGICIPSGCMDPQACNFNPGAQCAGIPCLYSCCPGPGCCDVGMHWDWELGMCQITNVADTNFDGCVQLNDLLEVLSAFGNCTETEVAEHPCSGEAFSPGDDLACAGWDYLGAYDGGEYYVSSFPLAWDSAQAFAAELNGGLAVISSQEENDWISDLVGDTYVWIGLHQDMSSPEYSEPDGGWLWVDGSSVTFENWAAPEPNNDPSNLSESCQMYSSGLWNDAPGADFIDGSDGRDIFAVIEFR